MPALIEDAPPPQDSYWTISGLKFPEEDESRIKAAARRKRLSIAAFARLAILEKMEREAA
jgi:hypothetical protein